MRASLAGLAGGMLAAALAGSPARGDTIASPVFKITDIGIAETKGINNAGQVFGTSQGRAFTTPSGLGTDTADPSTIANPRQTIGGLGDGYNIAFGLNAAGQVVGQLQVQTPQGTFLRPFLRSGETTTEIPTLGGKYGAANAVNSFGQVVGTSQKADGNEQGFVYNAGTGQTTPIGTFGGRNSDARGINDSGQIAGSAQQANGDWNAFIKTGDNMQSLGTLGGQNSWAFAINPSGVTVGASETASGRTHAFVFKDGEMHDLGTLGAGSFASAVNSLGQVVGWNTGLDNEYRAFLYDDGKMVDLNKYLPEGSDFAVLNGATGINDAGQIVGWGKTHTGAQRSFLLTPFTSGGPGGGDPDPDTGPGPGAPNPIPEPSTLAFFGLVAAAGLAHRFRARKAAQTA